MSEFIPAQLLGFDLFVIDTVLVILALLLLDPRAILDRGLAVLGMAFLLVTAGIAVENSCAESPLRCTGVLLVW